MKRICNKAKNFKDAEKWDIYQYVKMKPEEREAIGKKLIEIFYKGKVKDLRESRYFKCLKLNFQKT